MILANCKNSCLDSKSIAKSIDRRTTRPMMLMRTNEKKASSDKAKVQKHSTNFGEKGKDEGTNKTKIAVKIKANLIVKDYRAMKEQQQHQCSRMSLLYGDDGLLGSMSAQKRAQSNPGQCCVTVVGCGSRWHKLPPLLEAKPAKNC